MFQSPSQPVTVNRLFEAVYPSFALLAGLELDLFTLLKDGPSTLEQLAAALGVKPLKLRPLLYALVVAGLLNFEADQFANTAEANHYLVRGRPAYLGAGIALTYQNWRRVLDTSGAIRAGGPLEQFDYQDLSPAESAALFQGLHHGAIQDAGRLMEKHDFSVSQALLDVGGGSGGLSITIARAQPHLKASIIDLPSVIPITRQFVAEAGLDDRITILAGDAVHEALPGSYDVIVARHLLQVLSADQNQALLSNLAAALEPGGVLHIIGWILDDSRLSPATIVGYNLVLLNGYPDGQAYTEAEHRTWLADAGLTAVERHLMPDGASIISARKML